MQKFDLLNFEPVIVNNFFTETEIDDIENKIKNKIQENINNGLFKYHGFKLNVSHGSFSYGQNKNDEPFPNNIIDKINNFLENFFDSKLEQLDICWQRYTWESENEPRLRGHMDGMENSTSHLMTLTVPIRNDFIWATGVDYKVYELGNNDALIYNVTGNFHRRPHRVFTRKEKYDVVIVRFLLSKYKVSIKDTKYKDIESIKNSLSKLYHYEKNIKK